MEMPTIRKRSFRSTEKWEKTVSIHPNPTEIIYVE